MVKNVSKLPNLEYKIDERLNYFDRNENDILSIINLNASKAHGWDKRYKSFKDIQFLDEISNNLPNDLFGTNVYKVLKSCWVG